MRLSFHPMIREFAAEMAEWQYAPPYDVYGYTGGDAEPKIEYLTEPGNHFYAVLQDDELIGFRSFGEDGRVSGGHYNASYLDTGGGLRPDLTGQGLGLEFIREGLAFGRMEFRTRRFRVTIADFNKRAQRVCRRIGFSPSAKFNRTSDGIPFTIFTIGLE